jgi:uncharacterized protein with von Willebrand factor type A (vWA) domain
MLFKDGIVTYGNQVTQLVMIALNDHSKTLDSFTISIREMKQKLNDLDEKLMDNQELMKQELDNLKELMKAAMVENEENLFHSARSLSPRFKVSPCVSPLLQHPTCPLESQQNHPNRYFYSYVQSLPNN